MKRKSNQSRTQSLELIPKVYVYIYAIIAILFLVIPEIIAGIALKLISSNLYKLPTVNDRWNQSPEIRLASMNIKELREMARINNLNGYANQTRQVLSKRLQSALEINF